jgi:2-succinyl-6-hydroxy-2,4-cyclohexadiene-1-carboxylate synthase
VLESASPGLISTSEQQERRVRDEKLAERILSDGVLEFVDYWEKIPLFASQKLLPEAKRRNIRTERLEQKPIGLANSLIGMGTGAQSPYWEALDGLEMPVLLVTGKLDEKFCLIAERMAERLPEAKHCIIEAGHAIHVEKSVEFATMVEEYLSSYYRGGKS